MVTLTFPPSCLFSRGEIRPIFSYFKELLSSPIRVPLPGNSPKKLMSDKLELTFPFPCLFPCSPSLDPEVFFFFFFLPWTNKCKILQSQTNHQLHFISLYQRRSEFLWKDRSAILFSTEDRFYLVEISRCRSCQGRCQHAHYEVKDAN